jgi:hypothetical protein
MPARSCSITIEMAIMKRPEGTNVYQEFCYSSGKLHHCSSHDGIDCISFVVSGDSTATSLEAGIGSTVGICSKNGVGVMAEIGSVTGIEHWDFFKG